MMPTIEIPEGGGLLIEIPVRAKTAIDIDKIVYLRMDFPPGEYRLVSEEKIEEMWTKFDKRAEIDMERKL